MSLDDAVRTSVRSLSARPAEVLPFYVASLAVPVIVRVIPFAGLLASYLALRETGRLEAVRDVLEPAAPLNVDERESPDGVDDEALDEAMLDLLTPEVVAILAGTVLLAIVAFAAMQAAISAGKFHAVLAVLRGEPATKAGVDGVARRWTTYFGISLLEFLGYLALFAPPIGIAILATWAGIDILLLPVIGTLAFSIVGVFVVRFVFSFARVSSAVDDRDAIAAVRGGWGFVAGNKLRTFGYAILAFGLLGVANIVGSTFSTLGAAQVSQVLPIVVVTPLLDLVKTDLFCGHRDRDLDPPGAPEGDRLERVRTGARRGLGELGAFTRGHVGMLAASTLLFLGGIAIGLWAGAQVDDLFATSIEARLDRLGPLGAFFAYAANNWSVAAGQSLAGIAFGVPTAVSLVFNGANIGFLYQLEVDPEVLLAFVLPHGIIELPALFISGALGLHLGRVGWGYWRGSVEQAAVADEIDRAFQVLVGLAVLFVVAAAIEAFVSPYYWRVLGI